MFRNLLIKIGFTASFLALISGCENPMIDYTTRVQELNIELSELNKIIVIPNEGCGGCISGATTYAIENRLLLYDRGTRVVFTGVQDYKLFRNQVGADFLKSDLVRLDSQNLFMEKPVLSIYPQSLTIEGNEVLTVTEFDTTFDLTSLVNSQINFVSRQFFLL